MGDRPPGDEPGHEAYLDDPNDYTTGYGYGESEDSDTPAADEPDIDDDELDRLVTDGEISEALSDDGLVRGGMVTDSRVGLGRRPRDLPDPIEEA